MKTIVILISGRGSNMEAIVRAAIPGMRIAAVISNRPDAAGLAFARSQGIEAVVVDHKAYADRVSFDSALVEAIDRFAPDLVAMAGFMRILTDDFVRRYDKRMINIHPSLLPAFTGLHTHQRAIDAGAKVHGASVHFVTPMLDAGPIIAQAVVPVLDDDTPDSLAARVLQQEHKLYPQVLRWWAAGRLSLGTDGRVRLDAPTPGPTGWTVPPLEQ